MQGSPFTHRKQYPEAHFKYYWFLIVYSNVSKDNAAIIIDYGLMKGAFNIYINQKKNFVFSRDLLLTHSLHFMTVAQSMDQIPETYFIHLINGGKR